MPSIEENLTSIAKSLATLALIKSGKITITGDKTEVSDSRMDSASLMGNTDKPVQPAQKNEEPPSLPLQPETAKSTVTDIKPKTVALTVEDVDAILKAEYMRLGENVAPIHAIMNAAPYQVTSIKDIKPSQYDALIAAVKAIPAPA